jgi:hypothetical protein
MQKTPFQFCFGLSNAFNIAPYNLLLCKLSNFVLSSGYVSWFYFSLSNGQSVVRNFGTLSFLCVKSEVPQGSALGPLHYSIFINDIFDSTQNYSCLLCPDDFKIHRNVSNIED